MAMNESTVSLREEGEVVEVLAVFSGVQKELEVEQNLREEIRTLVRDLEQVARGIYTTMQGVHQCTQDQIPLLCGRIRPMFDPVHQQFQSLASLLPPDTYFKYCDQWRFVCQRLSFLAALLVYLETNSLASIPQVALLLGVGLAPQKGMHLELDDYLIGLLSMCSELSRLAVNSVILGDYTRPFEIATFTSDLIAGFRLLNLKNDFLRKKFDALKYDVKKVEEVVYDISIRGLKPPGHNN